MQVDVVWCDPHFCPFLAQVTPVLATLREDKKDDLRLLLRRGLPQHLADGGLVKLVKLLQQFLASKCKLLNEHL